MRLPQQSLLRAKVLGIPGVISYLNGSRFIVERPAAGPNPDRLERRTLCTETISEEHTGQPHKLCEGKTISLERCFTLKDVQSFCQLCQITNPIHLELPEAQLCGFSACVVPELLYAGLFPAIIGTHFGEV